MQVVMYLHNYAYKLRIPLLLLRKCIQQRNKDNREFVYTAAGLSGAQQQFHFSMWDKNNKLVIVTISYIYDSFNIYDRFFVCVHVVG